MQNWEREKRELINQVQLLCKDLETLKTDIEKQKIYFEKFNIIFEHSRVGIGILNFEQNNIEINDSFKDILNISQNIISKHESLAEFIHYEDIEKYIKLNREAVNNKTSHYKTIIRIMPRNKDIILWCNMNVSFIYGKEKPNNALIIVEDITDIQQQRTHLKQKLEKTKQENTELEQFASVVAHDLKNPLAVIISYLRIMKTMYDKVLDEEGKEMTAKVYERAEKMSEMIDSLLFYSRMSKNANIFKPCDLEFILHEAISNLEATIKQKNAEITHDKLPIVRGNKIQLTSLFQNLLDNSIKYCENKIPKIHISSKQIAKEKSNAKINRYSTTNKILISIKDNGIGIKPQDKEKIFEIFNRINEEKYSGSGIGLAFCKKIVERHQGSIWVESDYGKGSTFNFTLNSYKNEN